MTQDQILGALRIILPVLLAFAVSKGWIEDSDAASIVTAVITVTAVIWSVIVHSKKSIITKTAAFPEVSKVELKSTGAGRLLKTAIGSKPTVTIAMGPYQ